MTRIRGRGLVAATLVLALTACGSPESRAESDARDLVSKDLEEIEMDLAASLPGLDPVEDAERISSWVPGEYAHSINGDKVTLEFGVRRTGRDALSVGETTVAGGACFRVTGDRSGGTIEQVGCPRSFLREPGQPVEVEVELVDDERPLRTRDN